MRKLFLLGLAIAAGLLSATAQEYKVITVVESIVPMGMGRSRMIDNKQPSDYKKFTTERSQGTDSDQGKINRAEIKIDNMQETKLLNFYSIAGINFQNIASNDALIGSKLSDMAREGWQLIFVTSGVESDSGKDDGKGIFITRFVFKKG